MNSEQNQTETTPVERQRLDADIVCVGFGPATAGFLATLSKELLAPNGAAVVESAIMPGMPPQVLCYERADGIGFGVSGVVTRGRGIRESFPDFEPAQIPMAAKVVEERTLYLLDPHGASRRSLSLRAVDACLRAFKGFSPLKNEAVELPWTPALLHKRDGFILSLGQFMQWVGTQVQSTGLVQIWPGTPVSEPLFENNAVVGIRLLDQGVDKQGRPMENFMPGMDVRACLTVVGDGPVGAVGRRLDSHFGLPDGHHTRDWALGMKFVVDLPVDTELKPGTVLHTFGYPEPEIFGFLYVHPDRVASLGIFVPSWFVCPVRTAYRYLQHWMLHPSLWRYLRGSKLRSWGAKTIGESGQQGEPHLVGNGYARIGEGSGSTNVLTGSGVDEAWVTGTQLARSVLELLKAKKPFTKENLEATYVKRRRESWLEDEARIAKKSRNGFQRGVVTGLVGMALAGLTKGRLSLGPEPVPPSQRIPSMEDYYCGRLPREEIERLGTECAAKGVSLHEALMRRVGWPEIPHDESLLLSHQDALLIGGKVQAMQGYADHVVFIRPEICEKCGARVCLELCSGQAIYPGPNGVPNFDREKCVHCGACYWNCSQSLPYDPEHSNIAFQAGMGGLHSAEN